MRALLHTSLPALTAAAGIALLAACGQGGAAPWSCAPTGDGATCAGVSRPRICDHTFCTAGVGCKRVLEVGAAAAPYSRLPAAAAAARSGDCIALAAGKYEPALLPDGVSLLGAGAGFVRIRGSTPLMVKGGAGATLRGFTISGQGRGLALQNLESLTISQVRITGARTLALAVRASRVTLDQVEVSSTRAALDGKFGVGLQLSEGSRARVTRTWLAHSPAQGILVHESSLALADSVVERSGEHGVFITCSTSCGVSASTILRTTLSDSGERGVTVSGGRLVAKGLTIDRTRSSARSALGLEAREGADISLISSTVRRTAGIGVLLDRATGLVGSTLVDDSEMAGVWVQRIRSGAVMLVDNRVRDSRLAGVGLLDARGVTLQGGSITRTSLGSLLTRTSSVTTGDGVQVLSGSSADVVGVTVRDSARAGVIFDSSAGRVIGCTISGAGHPLVFQRAGAAPPLALDNRNAEEVALAPATPGPALTVPVSAF